MSDNARVEELLEQLLDSGGPPEDVCRDCPEMLAQVRAGWQRLRAIEAEVGAMFPQTTSADEAGPPALPTTDLPRIGAYELWAVLVRAGMGVVCNVVQLCLHRTLG